jgi:phage-related tail fiber protein
VETRILNNLSVHGTIAMSDNRNDFPANPAIGTMVVKDQCLYCYIKVGGLETWYPFASKTNSYIHSQGLGSLQWIVQHNLGTTDVWTQVKDGSGTIVQALVETVDENTLRVTFTQATTGTVIVVAPDSIDVPQMKASVVEVGDGYVIIDNSGVRIDGEYVLTSGNIEFYAQQAVAAEATARIAADNTLQANIDAEAAARAAADNTLQANIAAEAAARVAADTTLQANIAAEATSRIAADATLQANIAAEATSRIAADTTLQSTIDANINQPVKTTSTPTFSGINASGHIIPTTNEAYDLGSATNRFRDLYLSGNTIYVGNGVLSFDDATETFNFVTPSQEPAALSLSANTTDDLAEGTSNLYYTAARAQAVVAVEATARIAADNTLQANIAAEATARIAADNTLQANIDSLTASDVGAVAANTSITAGTATKITYDAKGLVTAGASLAATDIPNLSAAKITSGTMASARMPAFSGDATSVAGATALTLANSGVTAGTYPKVTVDAKGRVTAGASLDAADIPSLDAAKITSGTMASARLPSGSTAASGIIQLTDSTSSTSTTTAATPNSVKTAFDLANGKVASNTAITAGTATKITYDAKGLVTAGASLAAADIPSLDAAKITSGTLAGARMPAFSGDATSVAGATALTLANSGVTAGTYPKVTVDAKGRVTAGASLAATDIPNLSWSKITTDKPTTLSGYGITDAIKSSLLSVPNGVATLDAAGLVPSTQLPSYVDDVLEYATLAGFPTTGETGKIYVAIDTNKTYRWSGSAYVYITSGAVDSVAGKTGVVVLGTLTRGTYLTGSNYNGSAATTWAVDATSANTASKVVARDASGNFAAGVITATDFNATSDARKKTDVVDAGGTAVVDQLRGVEFNWVDRDAKSSGVIAQELESILPHLVATDPDGFKSVNYAGITAYLIEAVKELSARVKQLEQQ